MAFGTIYASWLTLIHSEIQHPWDPVFRKLGLGTASDHHVSILMSVS
jgi:lathosterol oxidase